MKEAVGGLSIFQIFIVFVIIFTGIVALSLNRSKAFSIKNEILTIIKNQGGICNGENTNTICDNFTSSIGDFLYESGYRTTGNCNNIRDVSVKDKNNREIAWIGFDRNGKQLLNGNNASFCVKGVPLSVNSQFKNAVYYKVYVWYEVDLPIVNSLFKFHVSGETSRIYSPNECQLDKTKYAWCS